MEFKLKTNIYKIIVKSFTILLLALAFIISNKLTVYPSTTFTPPRLRNAEAITLRLLIDGRFAYIPGRNFNYVNYVNAAKLKYALGVSFETYNQTYIPLRQNMENLNFRVTWVPTRNTILIDTTTIDTWESKGVENSMFKAEPLPRNIINQITGSSFHENPHFDLDHLAYLTITHVDFDGKSRHGHIIVAASIAEEVLDIFKEIYEAKFPIARVRLIDYYNASDYYSMADNNSVGFNYRVIAGTNTLSRHAWGMAIDINTIQNPYIRGNTIWPEAGANYLDRTNVRPGMIVPGDAVYNAFISRGWIWGGHWTNPIDYHHFEKR